MGVPRTRSGCEIDHWPSERETIVVTAEQIATHARCDTQRQYYTRLGGLVARLLLSNNKQRIIGELCGLMMVKFREDEKPHTIASVVS